MRIAALLALVAAAAGCRAPSAGDDDGRGPAVTGSVSYRERIALPADATLRVDLFDLAEVGRDGSARVATETFSMEGRSVPLQFELDLGGIEFDAAAPYALTARIDAGGGAMFRTPHPVQVLTNGAPSGVDLVLRRAGGGPPPSPELTATHWRARLLDARPVVPVHGRRHPFIVLLGPTDQYIGHGGANRFRGLYERDGDTLRFRPGPTTLMADEPDAMALEQTLLESLMATRSFRIEGDELTLVGDDGPIAIFDAAPLR